jgi:hypothetical protein
MRRPALLLLVLGLLALGAAAGPAAAAPQPDAPPGVTPDAPPQPAPPAPPAPPPPPTYTPPAPTYEQPVYEAPVVPAGPTPAAPGTAGADLVQASGLRIAAPLAKDAGAAAPEAPVETEPAPASEPAVVPEPPATEAAVPEPPATEAVAPAETLEAATPLPDPVAATVADEAAAAPVAAPELPVEPSLGGGDDGSSLPVDGLVLLLALLACGIVLGVRALRHGQRRLAVPLLAYCAGYILVVGGVFAGVAQAAEVADLEATPGDGEVLITWTPPASGTVVLVASTAAPAGCNDQSARSVPYTAGDTAAVDTGLANGVIVYYAACIQEPNGLLSLPKIVTAIPVSSTDGEAPPAVSGLRVSAEDSRVRLRWVSPEADDLAEIVIVRRYGGRAPGTPRDGTVVYRGLGRTTTDFPVSPRKRVWYSAFAVDDDENASTPASGSLPRFDPPLYAPRDGAKVKNRQLFRWRPVRGATYYNIQIWRGAASRKVISTWVSGPSYVLRRKLAAGRYTWYVWPGLGPRSLARYGGLIGRGSFTFQR